MKPSTFIAALVFVFGMLPVVPLPIGSGNLAYAGRLPCDPVYYSETGILQLPHIFAPDGNYYSGTLKNVPGTSTFEISEVQFEPNFLLQPCDHAFLDPNGQLDILVFVAGVETPYVAKLQLQPDSKFIVARLVGPLPAESSRLRLRERIITATHIIGRDTCPQPIGTLEVSNVGSRDTLIKSISFSAVTFTGGSNKHVSVSGRPLSNAFTDIVYLAGVHPVFGISSKNYSLSFNCDIPRFSNGDPIPGRYTAYVNVLGLAEENFAGILIPYEVESSFLVEVNVVRP